ncbi:hypothetical protein [Salinisphaera sp. T5B8]|uniref:hypothetical protein n=1 Tax=Salinisphaera sp. T5B8 TaxID=1304154 RepID=UPI00333E6DB6
MGRKAAVIALIALATAACGTKGPGYYGKPPMIQIHPNHPGLYLVDYTYRDMIENYGPGLEETEANLRAAKNNREIRAVWDKALTVAVSNYLELYELIPEKCSKGIEIVGNSLGEMGSGGATLISGV